MNHDRNGQYARTANGGKLDMPVLFLHGLYDFTETVASRLANPMRETAPTLKK